MDFYHLNFAGFALFNGFLALREYRQEVNTDHLTKNAVADAEAGAKSSPDIDESTINHFKKIFYVVYVLIFGADWLQVRPLIVSSTITALLSLILETGPFHIHFVQGSKAASRADCSCSIYYRFLSSRSLRSLRRLARR